ncbi:hypothetical protein PHLGIDRAFT_19456 [Phlebiopsis gigantea 11061_1 CR5-6]|uniref:Uncharacterized protein n=1 Tax=Phlebiopsis gigantea (strain 11061_1 CR5-6) TaxID=745531 RepID=A0A0C3S6U8_PHLG1|nr:hypothetical protein PHLGIDRAFT_19456 [Phlebiopsis gigantea 11061_1 CR5-6]
MGGFRGRAAGVPLSHSLTFAIYKGFLARDTITGRLCRVYSGYTAIRVLGSYSVP